MNNKELSKIYESLLKSQSTLNAISDIISKESQKTKELQVNSSTKAIEKVEIQYRTIENNSFEQRETPRRMIYLGPNFIIDGQLMEIGDQRKPNIPIVQKVEKEITPRLPPYTDTGQNKPPYTDTGQNKQTLQTTSKSAKETVNAIKIANHLTRTIRDYLALVLFSTPVEQEEFVNQSAPGAYRMLEGAGYFSNRVKFELLIQWLTQIPGTADLIEILREKR